MGAAYRGVRRVSPRIGFLFGVVNEAGKGDASPAVFIKSKNRQPARLVLSLVLSGTSDTKNSLVFENRMHEEFLD